MGQGTGVVKHCQFRQPNAPCRAGGYRISYLHWHSGFLPGSVLKIDPNAPEAHKKP
jgi:hypothetical protein